jgi:hypothetical protein
LDVDLPTKLAEGLMSTRGTLFRAGLGFALALSLWAEGAGKDIGSGAGDIGKGAAKGAGSAAKGVGKGAADLVTLHPVEGAAAVGKGAVGTGKDVGVGTAKGTGKMVKGVGKLFKKVL